MRRFIPQAWTVPIALLALVIFAYVLPIPWLGLYGDDWPYLWVRHVAGARGYIDFVAWDRPFSAWIYLLVTPVLGEKVWAYHLFLALLRWLNGALLWWVMKLLWPDRQRLAAWTALLFVIYPGFRQQPIPLEFMLHFSTLALFLFSLAAMLLSLRRPRQFWLFTLLNVLAASAVFGLEYFAGLELLRPVLIWLVLSESIPNLRRRAGKTLLYWLPNLLALAAFGIWRVFIFSFRTYQPEFLSDLAASPPRAVYTLALRILSDLRAVTFGAWRQVFAFPHEPAVLWPYILVFLASLVVVIFSLLRLHRTHPETENAAFLPTPLLLGIYALLAAGWPFWLTGLPVSLSFPWDRSTLAFMLGASWLMAGVVEMFKPAYQVYLLAVLVALAAGSQIQNAAAYRVESGKLRTFFWELSWRAPALQPGTILLSEQIPLNYYSDNSLTPPLNWTYAPDQGSTQQVYNFFDLDERLETTLPALEENLPVQRTYRSFNFSGNSSDILMVYYRPDRCLRVLGPQDNLLPDLPRRLSESLALSHLDQIDTDAAAARPPAHLVGAEPEHGWCYIFQSAELARQRGDWAQVASLANEALENGLSPHDSSEWLPFFDAAVHQKDWQRAENLSASILKNSDLQPALCRVWKTALEGMSLSESEQKNIKTLTGNFKCKK